MHLASFKICLLLLASATLPGQGNVLGLITLSELARRHIGEENAPGSGGPVDATSDGRMHNPEYMNGPWLLAASGRPRQRCPDTPEVTHVGMYEQKWVPFNGNPHQEVVVNEISTCSALVIVVGSRGAAAAHLTPDPKWWREEIEATIRHARQHHQAGDMYEVHAAQPDPKTDPSHPAGMMSAADLRMWERINHEEREDIRNMVRAGLHGANPDGGTPEVRMHWLHRGAVHSRANFHVRLGPKRPRRRMHETRVTKYDQFNPAAGFCAT